MQVTVDEVNIYDKALTANEVAKLYSSYDENEFVPDENAPDAYYDFNDDVESKVISPWV